MWGQGSQCRVSLGKAGGASCRARAPQARGNQPEKESRTHKPFLFKGAALACWSVCPCRSQLAPHSSWAAESGKGSFLHQGFVCLSPDAVLLRMTAPGRALCLRFSICALKLHHLIFASLSAWMGLGLSCVLEHPPEPYCKGTDTLFFQVCTVTKSSSW